MPWLLLFLIAGLVLVLAGGSWFAGAVTVGTILLIVVGVLVLLLILIGGAAFAAFRRKF